MNVKGFVMTEAEQCRRAIERCEAKRDKVSDAASKLYYTLCIAGWRRWLVKVEALANPSAGHGR